MKHELVQKLKNAGFESRDSSLIGHTAPDKDGYVTPHLSEMIDNIFENHINISFDMGGRNTWWAVCRDLKHKAIVPVQIGKTPEEAVAKLWLKLRNKL